jgi:hypothetical protein
MGKDQRSDVRDQRSGFPSIFDRQSAIITEFQEPLRDVIAGFVPLGMTRVEVAETLEVNPRSLRTFCEQTGIRFPRNQPDRRERIRESMRHSRRARILKHSGREQCLAAWAEEYGINRRTLQTRLRRGMSLRDALRA